MKSTSLPPVRVDAEFRAQAESILHEGESLTGFIEESVRRAVEHRRIQAAFEARARTSLERHRQSGVSRSVDDVFDNIEATIEKKRVQVFGPR